MYIEFYSDYLSMPVFDENNRQNEFKDEYIRDKLSNGNIYKFISFTDNISLNESKLGLLENKQIWASNYNNFPDKNELKISYNPYKILRKTGVSVEYVKRLIKITNQMNDVSCFTYKITDNMWNDYANNRNGVCLQFSLKNSDKFFPVIYLKKQKIDFTNYFITVLKEENKTNVYKELGYLAILPMGDKR